MDLIKEPPPQYFVSGEEQVNSSADAVWAVLSDFHGLKAWTQRVKKIYAIGEVKRGLGAARHCDIEGLGGIDEIITTWDEGHQLGYRVSAVGPIGVAFSLWKLESTGANTTRVILRLDYDIRYGAFGKLLHLLVLRRVLQSNIPRVLGTLKAHLER